MRSAPSIARVFASLVLLAAWLVFTNHCALAELSRLPAKAPAASGCSHCGGDSQNSPKPSAVKECCFSSHAVLGAQEDLVKPATASVAWVPLSPLDDFSLSKLCVLALRSPHDPPEASTPAVSPFLSVVLAKALPALAPPPFA